MEEITLTEREEAVAQRAADIAVERMVRDFYAGVGRSVIQRALIWIGAAVVGFAAAKGWIKFGD